MPRDVECRFVDEIRTGSKSLAESASENWQSSRAEESRPFPDRGSNWRDPLRLRLLLSQQPLLILSPKGNADQVTPS